MMWRFVAILLTLFIFADSNIVCKPYETCLSNTDKPTSNQNGGKQDQSLPKTGIDNKKYIEKTSNLDLGIGDKEIHKNRKKTIAKLENKQKIYSDEILFVRNKRSSPTLMKMFKTLFIKPSTVSKNNTDLPVPRQNSIQPENTENEKILEFIELLHQFNETLLKLDEKLSHLEQTQDNEASITIKIPILYEDSLQRSKREITDDSHNITTKDNVTVTENIDKVYGNKTLVTVDDITEANTTKPINNSSKSQKSNTDDVLIKIDTALKDVQNQLSAVKSIKDSVSSDETFKIGYIVASLENLELTLEKLVSRISTRKNKVNARKFLGNVEQSKHIVINLMEYLRMHQLRTTNKS